jgi:hypothetical protein
LTEHEQAICEAWRKASKDLDIAFTSPFSVITSAGRIDFLGLVHDFGRKTGTLICLYGHVPRHYKQVDMNNFLISALANCYDHYDRSLFIETLKDWQWHGENNPPSWYSGVNS